MKIYDVILVDSPKGPFLRISRRSSEVPTRDKVSDFPPKVLHRAKSRDEAIGMMHLLSLEMLVRVVP